MVDGTIPVEMQDKYFKIILFETERLTDLTQDLLTLNQLIQRICFGQNIIDIHEVIKNTAATFEGTCTGKRISIKLLFATKVLNVSADKRKIQQVLYNLLDNAIKFSPNDSEIIIETTEHMKKYLFQSRITELESRKKVSIKFGNVSTRQTYPAEKIKKELDLGFPL